MAKTTTNLSAQLSQSLRGPSLTIWLCAASVWVFIIWASFAWVDEIVRGEGEVISSSRPQIIQNLEGGILTELPVKEGDEVLRGDVLALKEREFVLAARSIGTPNRRLVMRHILPNVLSPIMVSATLGIATAIITESALSFLGFGFPPDFPTWGRLLFDSVDRMVLYPERVIWPGLLISLTVLSVNYIGDGLRDALDPRIRGR